MNPFTTLGLAETASPDEVKAAFRAQLRQVHPDLVGSAGHLVTIDVITAYRQALVIARATPAHAAEPARVEGFVPASHRAYGDATPRTSAFVASTFRAVA